MTSPRVTPRCCVAQIVAVFAVLACGEAGQENSAAREDATEVEDKARSEDNSIQSNKETADLAVCPACRPMAGGQTSDFDGGTPDICSVFLERVAADADELATFGIDLAGIHALISREFNLPLFWSVGSNSTSKDPSGVTVEGLGGSTRVQGTATIEESIFARVDESQCDEVLCRSPDGLYEAPRAECDRAARLEVPFTVSLQTEDEAVRVEAGGTAFYSQTLEYPRGTALADIVDVEGRLRLTPTAEGESHARLRANLYFHPTGLEGVLAVDFKTPQGIQWSLVSGSFPEPPPAPAPGTGGAGRAEPDETTP